MLMKNLNRYVWLHLAILLSLKDKSVLSASNPVCYSSEGGFTKEEWAHCQQIQPDLFLYYQVLESSGNVKLGLHAASHENGWSALALGGNGGMKGASQIVVRKEIEGNDDSWIVEDRHSFDYVTPSLDESQDVQLLFASQNSNGIVGTSWGVKVMINSCDSDDYPIEDKMTWMHWALGGSHDFFFHGDKRGQFQANLMRAPIEEDDLGELVQMNLKMPSISLDGPGGAVEVNNYLCTYFDLATTLPDHDVTKKHHAVRISPLIDPVSQKYVHHMVLFGCTSNSYDHGDTFECVDMPEKCPSFMHVGAVGGGSFTLPPNVGLPFGEHNTGFVLQVHYYNPSLDTNIVDSSGLSIFIADDLRAVDAGVMVFNGGLSRQMRPLPIPANESDYSAPPLLVPNACTKKWESSIHVMTLNHHAHDTGKNLELEVIRSGTSLGLVRNERIFDYNHQSDTETSIKTIYPGDELLLTCTYDTSDKKSVTRFGPYTENEMCFAVMIYYPAQVKTIFNYVPMKEWLLPNLKSSCLNPGNGEFSGISQCAEMYLTDISELTDSNWGYAGAKELCSDDSDNLVCPPCSRSSTCTDSDFAMWGQNVICTQLCRTYGDLSVYPDLSSSSGFSHATLCTDDTSIDYNNLFFDNNLYFSRDKIFETPTCATVGDLNSATSSAPTVGDLNSATSSAPKEVSSRPLFDFLVVLACLCGLVS